jgi:hypothetical protein
MKMLKHIVLTTVVCMTMFGCAGPSMYYWGNYSASLYAYKKNPGDGTLLLYKKSLINIIERSPKYNLRVPPGVYCEYGYMMAKAGNAAEATKYFDLEKSTYPESAFFMDKLKMHLVTSSDSTTAKKE